jgi:hypothetical protein
MRRLWWLAACIGLWLVVASCVFLWLAGLWDNPRIPWWSRPWQWLTYARHGDGSFSELLYLIVSAVIAAAALMPPLRLGWSIFLRQQSGNRDIYGKTEFASLKEMQANKITTTQRPV